MDLRNLTQSTPVTSLVLVGIIAFVMIGGGLAHLIAPAYFAALVPPFLPAGLVVIAAGVVQIIIGVSVLLPRTRAWGALAFAALCLAYMPLHLWDFFRPDPVFAPPVAASIRLAVQAAFVWIGWVLWRRGRPSGTPSR